MVNTNAVAVALCAADGVIDKMELETGVFGAEDLKFLGKYQTKLSSARTSASDDQYFGSLFLKWLNTKSGKK